MIALLYDIHGNLPALEAVVAHARERGARQWFLGGDYTAFGAWPAETLAALERLEPAVWIRGNWERWLGGDDADMPPSRLAVGAKRHALDAVPPEVHERLFQLPATYRRGGALYCHGSPRSDMEGFMPEGGPEDEAFIGDDSPARIVFGHTHLQFHRKTSDGRELINPGSVGLPWDGDPRAAYALLPSGVGEVQLHRVAYDHELVARSLRALDQPWASDVAEMVLKAGR